jgi:transcriptional regulator with XRE-family HTH domain
MGKRAAGFGLALQRVRSALGLSQDAFGARLGVSRRTLTRWEIHEELPPLPQRKHIATSFPDVAADLRAALARSLQLDDAFVASLSAPTPVATVPAAVVEGGAVDAAFLELCERLELPPGRLRTPLAEFVRRAEASGLSLATIRARLEPKTSGSARQRRSG